jgi:hypothetical protein
MLKFKYPNVLMTCPKPVLKTNSISDFGLPTAIYVEAYCCK